MTTFADLAGVTPPDHADGISIVPTLKGKSEMQEQRDYLYWEYHWGKQQAIRMGKYKGIRIGGTKELIEIYDLSNDIGEQNNIAGENPELVSEMDSLMKAARTGSPYNKFWPIPEYRNYNIRWDKWLYDNIDNNFAK